MRLPESVTPKRCLEWFVLLNLAFLGGDVALAHTANSFAHAGEWVPVAASAAATLLLLPSTLRIGPQALRRFTDLLVGSVAIGVGVLGMLFHLASGFFAERTLRSLVYAAPFIAPLAYVGVGLLVMLLRLESESSFTFGLWVLVLAVGGFAGNFLLSLLDHAQNGFFVTSEWIAVVAASFGCSFLSLALVWRARFVLKWCLYVCLVEGLVGMLGFVLHAGANWARPATRPLDRFLFGAPVFAPLLFTNLALLAALGLWSLLRGLESAEGGPPPGTATLR